MNNLNKNYNKMPRSNKSSPLCYTMAVFIGAVLAYLLFISV